MDAEMKSIHSIQECMDNLGFRRSEAPSFEIDAELTNLDTKAFGLITVTFNCNWHSGDGPYISLDDTIRSFGIHYTEFRPRWQNFKYSKQMKTLSVSGDGYQFSLKFEASET